MVNKSVRISMNVIILVCVSACWAQFWRDNNYGYRQHRRQLEYPNVDYNSVGVNPENVEWFCTNPKTQDTMIITDDSLSGGQLPDQHHHHNQANYNSNLQSAQQPNYYPNQPSEQSNYHPKQPHQLPPGFAPWDNVHRYPSPPVNDYQPSVDEHQIVSRYERKLSTTTPSPEPDFTLVMTLRPKPGFSLVTTTKPSSATQSTTPTKYEDYDTPIEIVIG